MSERLTSDPEPEANLGYLFQIVHERFRAALDDALRDLGMSAQEYAVLSVFGTRSELSTSELARITHVTRQTMHSAVLALWSAGLLERRPRNQRVVLICATKRGHKTLVVATDRVRAIERSASGWAESRGRAGRTSPGWAHPAGSHTKHSTNRGRVKEKGTE